MVTMDEIKAQQNRVQSSKRNAAEKARGLQEAEKAVANDLKSLEDKNAVYQKEEQKKNQETQRITEQLKTS